MSAILVVGLAMASTIIIRVFGRKAARTASESVTSTKVASMPYFSGSSRDHSFHVAS